MNRNYTRPHVDQRWHETRDTHPAVAMAIHAISSSKRSPEGIWEAPTAAEWDHVKIAVDEYITHGDFEPADDGYAWGLESITGPKPASV